jgi:hypothetical protein
VLIFDCRLDHTAAPNDSDAARTFVQVRAALSHEEACARRASITIRRRKIASQSEPATLAKSKITSDCLCV